MIAVLRLLVPPLLLLLAAGARAEPVPEPDRALALEPSVPVVEIPVDPAARITLVAPAGAAAGVARELSPELPAERRALEELLGALDVGHVEIRIAYGREEFRALQPRGARGPGWAAGLAYPRLGLVIVDAQASARGGDVRSVVRHELAHVALGRLVRGDVPRWFTEGFAILYAGEWSLSRSTTLARASTASALIDVGELVDGWPSSPTEVDLAYAQSASLVAFLASAGDGLSLQRLVRELRGGLPFDDALLAAYGKPPIVLEIEWKRTLRARYGWLQVVLDTQVVWTAAGVLLAAGAWRARARRKRRLAAMAADPASDDPGPGPWDDALAPEIPLPPREPETDAITLRIVLPDASGGEEPKRSGDE